MLTTILLILKIIGLVLLGILGLILLLVLLVLLVPIRYRAEGSYYEAPDVKARVTWFLHILSVNVEYRKELDVCVRVFGICVKRISPAAESDEDVPKENTVETMAGRKTDEVRTERKPGKSDAETQSAGLSEQKKKELTDQLAEDERRMREKKSQKVDTEQKKVGLAGKIRAKAEQISDKAEEIKAKMDEILAFIKDEANQRTFRLVMRQVYGIAKHILPTKIKGKVKFGFEDPFKTGQILIYVSPFYSLYAKHLELIPVFEEPVMEGELRLKGRIRIGTVLAKAVRVLFDRNIWKLIKRFRNR